MMSVPASADSRSGPPGRLPLRGQKSDSRGKRWFPPRCIWDSVIGPLKAVFQTLTLLFFASQAIAAPPGAVIENQASFSYTNASGTRDTRLSNPVSLVTAVVRSPASVELTRVATGGSGTYLETVGPGACISGGSVIPLGDPVLVGGNSIDPAQAQQVNASLAYNSGEPVFLRLADSDQNLDYLIAETVTVTVTSSATGDSEQIQLTETGLNTGVFAGFVPSAGGAGTSGDCTLQTVSNTDIDVFYTDVADASDTARNSARVDPTQRVFDSSTGLVVNGSLVSLVDAATGQPAVVYGNDGVSQFPSSIIAGSSVTDSSGTVYVFSAGEFRFPVVPDGQYRLDVTPPPQFSAPSIVSVSDLQQLPGAPFDLSPASFGNPFAKSGGLSFAVDIPVDVNASQLFLQKRTTSTQASLGDFIRFELTLQNTGPSGVATDARIVDTLPAGMRYVAGSARWDGNTIEPDVSSDTRTLVFEFNDLPAGAGIRLSYVVEVVSGDKGERLTNRATASAGGGLQSNAAESSVILRDELFRDSATLIGRVLEADCTDSAFTEEQGVAGIRVYLEDGRYAVTDEGGRFHFEGLKPGRHVAQLDPDTVPPYFDAIGCAADANFAGRTDSRFVAMGRGSLKQANFFLKRKPAPEGRVELALSAAGGNTTESVIYDLDVRGIGNVQISNIDLMVVLPNGVSYVPDSMRIDGQDVGEPRKMNQALSFVLPDRRGNWSATVSFAADIDADVNGELATRALATFDTPMESRQRTPVAETLMLREPAEVQNAGYVLDLKFDVLSAELSPGDRQKLDALIADWQGVRDIQISAIGHSDSQRIAPRNRNVFADNYVLSRARAESAANYLAARLSTLAGGMQVDGRGPDDPVADNATAEGRQKNRRVELVLTGLRPSKPSFLEVTQANSGVKAIETTGAIPGTEIVEDERFKINPDAGMPAAQITPSIDSLSGGYEMLHPAENFSPAIPATKVAIKHKPTQKVSLTVNGRPASALEFEATDANQRGSLAVSRWRTVALEEGSNTLRAEVVNPDGSVAKTLTRDVYFAGPPSRAEVLPERSRLSADGKQKPVLALRLYDKAGKPARPGMTGNFKVRDPYRSWFDVEDERTNDLVKIGDRQSHYRIGEDGIAFVELEPTSRAGELVVDLAFENGREQEVRGWLSPAERDWILVGFAEGTAGYQSLSDNMLAASEFEEGTVTDGRVSFFAKGQIKGSYLLTLAYDSDRERDESRFDTVVDPNEYYPLYADESEQRFEAASQRKLFVKLEREQFVALFGDYQSGLTITELARYERALNGLKSEYRGENVGYTAFAAETSQAFNRDEIQGDGTSGLYRLSRSPIIVNSESVRIETRDRLDTGRVLETRNLSRFVDYTLDPFEGTLFFKRPIPSRDLDFNPVFIVVEYETRGSGSEELVAGGRISVRTDNDLLEVGATYVSDETTGAEASLTGTDLRWQASPETLVKAEYAQTESTVAGSTVRGTAQKIEIQHTSERAEVRAYVREVDDEFGLGYQSAADRGVRRLGIEGRGDLTERLSILGEAGWQQHLETEDIRSLARATVRYEHEGLNLSLGLLHAEDDFEDGERRTSDSVEAGVSQRFLDDRLLLRIESITAMSGGADNVDFGDSLLIGADYRLFGSTELVAEYETSEARGIESQMTRLGLRASPWKRAQINTNATNEVSEFGPRLFANVGLLQGVQIGENWAIDIGVDQSNTLIDSEFRQFDDERELRSGSVGDDFLAAYVGALYTADLWSANIRAETRNSDQDRRNSLLFGWYREPEQGHGLSAGLTIFDSETDAGFGSTAADLKFGWAYRKAGSRWSFLDRADFVVEEQTGVDAQQKGWRLINNFNASRRIGSGSELSLQYAFKYVRTEFDDQSFTGYSDLVGIDYRHSLGSRWDVGAAASVYTSWESDVRDYGFGVDLGYKLGTNMWVSVGYNVAGYYDEDFADARYSAKGPFVRFAIKADQHTLKRIAGQR